MIPAISLLVIGSVFLAAESGISEAFSEGSIQGKVKLFSYDIDKESNEDAYATALGGYLKYKTSTEKIIYGAVRFHTSNPVGPNKNREATALFNSDKNGDALTANSEAYIGWNGTGRVLKVGNLMLSTPMMNDDTTRIVPWSYQGAAYTGETLPNTRVQLYHINQIRSHTSDQYKKESASGAIGSGITMLSIEYDGFENLDLQSYYYYAPDLYSTFIAQADYKLLLSENDLICASIQYFNSGDGGEYAETENRNGGDDINLLAIKAGFDTDNWLVSLSYSQNFGISGIVKGYGGLAKVYTTSMVANGRGNYKPETWMLKTHYDFPKSDWGQSQVALTLTNTRTKESRGDDFDAYYLHWKHNFNADISLFVRFEDIDHHNEKGNVKYLRVIASYSF